MLFDLVVVLLLIAGNGVLAMAELALVSSRKPRLQAMRRRRVRGAQAALQLFDELGRFLSTVQIGITLVGVLAGAFSGARLSEPLTAALQARGVDPESAAPLALALVVGAVTYLSLIVGELVPKRLALRDPERTAVLLAPAMRWLARLAAPMVWLLDRSSALLMWLLRVRDDVRSTVSDEEIRALVTEAARSGVVEPEEREMISGVMRLADRSVRAIMTPRQDVDWIDLDAPRAEMLAALRASRHSRLVAARGSIDQHAGLVTAKRLVDSLLDGAPTLDPAAEVEEALVIPDSLDALDAMAALRRSQQRAALVVDEFGSLQGLVTTTDVLSAIAGEFHSDEAGAAPAPQLLALPDGSWRISGALPADALAEHCNLSLPPERGYETVAGLVLHQLGHLPGRGETVEVDDWLLEVEALDGRRIDRLRLRRSPTSSDGADAD